MFHRNHHVTATRPRFPAELIRTQILCHSLTVQITLEPWLLLEELIERANEDFSQLAMSSAEPPTSQTGQKPLHSITPMAYRERLPACSEATVCANRVERVSGFLASSIHRTHSFRFV